MKKLLTTIALTMSLSATSAVGEGSMFLYLADGRIEPFIQAEIDSIRMVGGNQEIWTPDSTYTYPLADILRVSFEAPKTVARPGAINLATHELGRYIKGTSISEWGSFYLNISEDTPEDVLPEYGTYIYQIEPSSSLPDGIVGKVGRVDNYYEHVISLEGCNLSDIFDSLAWDNVSVFNTGEGEAVTEGSEEYDDEEDTDMPEASPRRANEASTIPWLASYNHYPHLLSGAYILSDELKDIPVGPAQGRIDSKVRMLPRVRCAVGAYVLGGKRGTDGEWEVRPEETVKMYTSLDTKVEAEASGRGTAKSSRTLGSDKSVKYSLPLGLGQKCTVTFKGTLKVEGTMGIDYKYAAAYRASSTATTMIDRQSDLAVSTATGKSVTVTTPTHQLDASMDGKLSLTASLTVTALNVVESLKSISTTYTFGSGLSGSALYKTSQLEEAKTENALYQRITAEGIEAKPVESISHMLKFESENMKPKVTITPTPATKFYAVPPFDSVTYDGSTMTFGINKEGHQMEGRKSQLGFKVKNTNNGQFTEYKSSAVWSGVTTLTGQPKFNAKTEIVYPTATLCGVTILGSPTYPMESRSISPITSYMSTGACVIRSGIPILGSHTSGNTTIIVGYPPVKGKAK